jgi:hypothetical protein
MTEGEATIGWARVTRFLDGELERVGFRFLASEIFPASFRLEVVVSCVLAFSPFDLSCLISRSWIPPDSSRQSSDSQSMVLH